MISESQDLLVPVSASHPCGDDLEYDGEYVLLLQVARGKPEQQYGATVIAAEPPDWRKVGRSAEALLSRSKDLRIAALWAQAAAHTDGIAGYARGLALVHDLLDRWWDEVHPRLEVDGEHDPLPRMNALQSAMEHDGLSRALLASDLLTGPHGSLTLKQVEQAIDGSGGAGAADREPTRRRLCEAEQAGQPAVLGLLAVVETLSRIRSLLEQRLEAAWWPEVGPLEKRLRRVTADWPRVRAPEPASDATAAPASAGSGISQEALSGANPLHAEAWRHLELHRREDLAEVLDKACRYFERHEPGHPAPLLLRRARRLLDLSFPELMQDIAPLGVPQMELLMGPAGGARADA